MSIQPGKRYRVLAKDSTATLGGRLLSVDGNAAIIDMDSWQGIHRVAIYSLVAEDKEPTIFGRIFAGKK